MIKFSSVISLLPRLASKSRYSVDHKYKNSEIWEFLNCLLCLIIKIRTVFITQVIKRSQCQRSTSQVKAEDREVREAEGRTQLQKGGVITGAGDVE